MLSKSKPSSQYRVFGGAHIGDKTFDHFALPGLKVKPRLIAQGKVDFNHNCLDPDLLHVLAQPL